jgi:hypothetical protein
VNWVYSIFHFFGWAGAGLVHLALLIGWLLASAYAGIRFYLWTDRRWTGWLVGILAALLLYAILGPTIDAVQSVSCRGAPNHAACMADDDDDSN